MEEYFLSLDTPADAEAAYQGTAQEGSTLGGVLRDPMSDFSESHDAYQKLLQLAELQGITPKLRDFLHLILDAAESEDAKTASFRSFASGLGK